MNYIRAFSALLVGLKFCFGNKKIRGLSAWPWFVGAVCYCGSLVGAYYLHPVVLDWLVGVPEGFWSSLLYYLAWVFVGLVLLVATMLLSVVLVMIFTSVFQTAIAANVLTELGRNLPPETPGLKGMINETGRTIWVEALKLIWLVPLLVCALVIGFIPFLMPVAVVLGAWLLAYQFVDIVLDIYRMKAWERFRFSLGHWLPVTCFGLTLSLLWAIPFVGLLLPPAAVAGAAWLLSESKILDEIGGRNRSEGETSTENKS